MFIFVFIRIMSSKVVLMTILPMTFANGPAEID